MSTSAVNKAQRQGGAAMRVNPQQRGLIIIGIIVVLAVVAVIAIVALGSASTGTIDFTNVPKERAADGGFVIGNPDAPITLVEFADFGCPHCQAYQPTMHQFITDFVLTGKAKFEYRMFPTAGGDLSVFTGKLLECAEQQRPGAFWDGYNLMFGYATSGRYTRDVGRLFAQDANLDYSTLLNCTDGVSQVTTDTNLGSSSGVTGTPSTMIRYGDSAPQFITYGGSTYDRGGAPYNVLEAVVNAANNVQ